MNFERMEALAEELEAPQLPVLFNMRFFQSHEECGTAYCIGGLACVIFSPNKHPSEHLAIELLELGPEQAESLFYNEKDYIAPSWTFDDNGFRVDNFSRITRQEAAAAVRKMIAEEKAARA